MTVEDEKELLDACKPTPCIMIGGSTGSSPQENANRAWRLLGDKMGFDYMTVKPGGSNRFFSAVPSETDEQRSTREFNTKKESLEKQIKKIDQELAEKKVSLQKLLDEI